ncbi:DinI family protein [[Actinobacillus] muris]|uniref:DinI family protein n=1 Tax=Muribacter muris TaxID=67855 RepID=A0A0J5P2F1_9PAST|nr:DinI-like family protein [Muribacter muris]KMK50708.1 DinI family protein [[Actinobacillus] muris] [Muribacter muris]MBF0784819.1 DinI-like family protein [Muribacter muris]MBF0826623.1 DinI-like family protein [Muribacter muris]TFV11053.1 DinI family protein [Muribacter muris]
MKVLDIRFVKERDTKKLAMQEQTMDKLLERLPERIAEKFEDVNVRVRFSSASGFDISGFRGDEKEDFLAFLEELWDDPFLLED